MREREIDTHTPRETDTHTEKLTHTHPQNVTKFVTNRLTHTDTHTHATQRHKCAWHSSVNLLRDVCITYRLGQCSQNRLSFII